MDNRNILGIDIGTSLVKVFIGTVTADGNILIAGNGTMPTAGFAKGVITDAEALAVSVHQAVECALMVTDLVIHDAYIGIGGEAIHSVNGMGSVAPSHIEGITQEDIQRVYQAAILANVAENHEVLHILPKNFFVDKQRQSHVPLQQKGTHLEVEAHIVIIPTIVVETLTAAIEKFGIHVLGFVANSIVGMQTLPQNNTQLTLFMDIGAGTTEVILYRGQEIYFSTSLPLGGDYITNDIMQGFMVSYNHAEEIKKYYGKLDKKLRGQNLILDFNDYGTTDKQFAYDFLYDIIESRIEEIMYLIKESLKTIVLEDNIEVVFLTGGCAAMPSFGDSAEILFGVPVQVVMAKELLLEYASPGNVACYGVLTYAMNNRPEGSAVVKDNAWQSLLGKFKKMFNS